jgi:hypothetical protein
MKTVWFLIGALLDSALFGALAVLSIMLTRIVGS